MEKRIQAVVLDWAGTVIDYGCFAPLHVFLEVFKQKGIEITMEEARQPMGLLKIDHIRALTNMPRIREEWQVVHGQEPMERDVQDMYQQFEEILFTVLPSYATPITGAVEMVARLRAKGMQIGSTTGYTKEMMDVVAPIAKQHGYEPDVLITPNDVTAGRPYPWMCYQNAMALGVYPMGAMVKVEDTISDIQEGCNAGMWTVGVILGSSELGLTEQQVAQMDKKELARQMQKVRTKFVQAGAHYTIDSIGELDKVIELIEAEQLIHMYV